MLQKRAVLVNWGLPPPPVEHMTLSAPYCARMSISLRAMMSMASSQLMRFHLFSPRLPTRIRGYLLRLGL